MVAQRSTQTGRTTEQRRPAQGGQLAYERLNASVDAAQVALKELRGELGCGSRELLHDGAAASRRPSALHGSHVVGKLPPDLPPLEPEGPPDEEPEPDEPLEPAPRPEEEPVPA